MYNKSTPNCRIICCRHLPSSAEPGFHLMSVKKLLKMVNDRGDEGNVQKCVEMYGKFESRRGRLNFRMPISYGNLLKLSSQVRGAPPH